MLMSYNSDLTKIEKFQITETREMYVKSALWKQNAKWYVKTPPAPNFLFLKPAEQLYTEK